MVQVREMVNNTASGDLETIIVNRNPKISIEKN